MFKLILIAFCFCFISVKSQDYTQAIGFRGGQISGITAKFFIDTENAYEGLVASRFGGIHLALYKLKHKPANINACDKLFFYSGYGVHAGVFSNYQTYTVLSPYRVSYKRNGTYAVIGLSGVLGLEYRLLKYPFVINLDFIPYFDLFGPNYFNMHINNIAFSIKYCIN